MKNKNKKKVFVAMSGGVDSSVAAALLKQSGDFEVAGYFMKCWSAFDQCSIERDAEDAKAVAKKLDIPFRIFDFEREYRQKVFDYMVGEYAAGRTPNPDVFCNSEIKFGVFLEKALALGADFVATGHYARKKTGKNSKCRIFQANDKNKDQSYFLWRLKQEQLKHILFPIGGYLKNEVREAARKFSLPTADKKDSQGLCFVGKVKFREFLRSFLPENPGPVISTSGKKIGWHGGLNFYTIGQRHGIKIGGMDKPLYVAAKDFKTNALIVADGSSDPSLYKKETDIGDINWIWGREPEFPLLCEARIRYRQPLQQCVVKKVSSFKLQVSFDNFQRAVAAGQSAVFYEKSELLGGGIIV